MHIDVKRLEENGWAVEIDKDMEHITIHPTYPDHALFEKCVKMVSHPDLRIHPHDADRIADRFVRDVQRTQIMDLVD